MQRKEFLKIAGLTTLSIPMMSALNKLENITDSFDSSKRMPVLFLGHGSPMNGIEDNSCSNSCSPFSCTSIDDHLNYLGSPIGIDAC